MPNMDNSLLEAVKFDEERLGLRHVPKIGRPAAY